MKIVNFKSNTSKVRPVDGNLAIKLENEQPMLYAYEKPEVKKLVLKPQVEKKDTRIFMGCYSYSWPANDGDGC